MVLDEDPILCDDMLLPLINAEDEAEIKRQLNHLLVKVVDPIVIGIVQSKMRVSLQPRGNIQSLEQQDAEDIHGDTIAIITQQLREIASSRNTTIRDFRAYVGRIVYHVFGEYIGQKSPERAKIGAQIQRVLTMVSLFELWDDTSTFHGNENEPLRPRGKRIRLCGMAEWKRLGRRLEDSHNASVLRNDPRSIVHEVKWGSEAKEMPLPQLLESLFNWIGHPASYHDLVSAVASIRGVTEDIRATGSQNEQDEDLLTQFPDHRTSVPDQIILADYLACLWRTMRTVLTQRQSAVILLDTKTQGKFLALFQLLGVATPQDLTALMGITVSRLSDLWDELPLGDEQIAGILQMSAPQVVQLRRAARQKLERHMKDE
jgi:hypothetical protein